jgi:hypothetical protein
LLVSNHELLDSAARKSSKFFQSGRPMNAKGISREQEGALDTMKTLLSWQWLCSAGLGLALLTATGCQTWVPAAGLTLPSPHYLEHPPQFIPSDPEFPLTNELMHMEEDALAARERAPVP